MPTCAANNCSTRSADLQISMYRFPFKNENLLRQWTKNMNRRDGKWSWKPNSNSRLCSKHFAEDCFYKCTRKRVLLPNAVPTIFWDDEVPKLSTIDAKLPDSVNILVMEEPPSHNDTTGQMDVAEYYILVARRGMTHDHRCLWLKEPDSTVQQRFPLKDEDLLRQWTKNINRKWSWEPNGSSRLCSKHFAEDCFEKYMQKRVLLPNAVPTIFWGDKVPKLSTIDVELSDTINILVVEEPPPPSDTTEEMGVVEYHLLVARRGMTHDHRCLWLKDSVISGECKSHEEIKASRKKIKIEQQKNRRLRKRESSLKDVIKDLQKQILDTSFNGSSEKVSKKLLIRKRLLKRVQQRMLLQFCPQCGTKLQTGFRFCPSCGEKLPGPVGSPGPSCPVPMETTSSDFSQLDVTDAVTTTASSDQLRQGTEVLSHVATPPHTSSLKRTTDESPRSMVSPRKRRAVTTQVKPIREEEATETTVSSPVARKSAATVSSPTPRSPGNVKVKAKKAKKVSAIEPLQEGEELSDTTGRKWCLLKVLDQSEVELTYAVQQSGPGSSSSSYKNILKLGAKDGRIFNEQNFFQRAAKPSSVDKWMKHSKTDFIGLPYCVGFGLHADAYRFLVFPNMGQTLQSIMEDEDPLPEAAVLQLACRILDVLEFIHENEYVHADIQAQNIYVHQTGNTQVYLAGYCHAFRYCPGGRHVEYREDSRTPHEGALEFISLESHKGAGPSRRSDLQALGYCLLRWHTGVLPWSSLTHTPARVAAEKQRFMEDVPGLLSHCYGQKTVSRALQSYLSQVMSLQYCEQPDYQALKERLHAALLLLGGSLEQPLSLQNTTRRR